MRTAPAFLFAAVAAFSAAPLPAAWEDVTRERFPDADSVVVDGLEDIAYNPDGTYTSEESQTVKILTEKGRREEGEITLRYNKRYGKSEIVSVTVTGADGSEREVDIAATTKESVDNASAGENIYDPMSRKVVCTIPGLKIGDLVTQRIRRSVFASRIENQWADIAILEWQCPMLRQSVRVRAPKALPLKSIVIRNPLGNVVEEEERLDNGDIVRTWTATNSPQAFPEPDMPPLYTQVQSLRLSTASDWREISRWYWNLCLPHLEKADDAIKAKVAEIGGDIPSLYKWVAQEIRYMGLTMEDTSPGYSPHDVDITFGNRYGVCRDKAALLVAMLRIAGHEAFPVLIHAGAKMDEEVPMPYFNHAVVAVRAPQDPRANNDGYILMDPTDESSRDLMPAYLSDRSYLVACPEGERLLVSPVPPAEANAVKVDSKVLLSRDGSMLLKSEASFGGVNDNAYRGALLRRKPEERRKIFENAVLSIAPGAELLECAIMPQNLQDTSVPLTVSLAARIPEALVKGETRAEMQLPLLSRTLGSANWLLSGKTSLEKRRYPLTLDSTAMTSETLDVELGDSLGRAVFLPENENLEGKYSYSRTCVVEDGHLKIARKMSVGTVEFSPSDYLDMREGAKTVEAADRERPVFACDAFDGANVHILRRSDEIDVSSPRDWVVTNEVSMQILTYDGKKKFSELKYSYNPAWRTVDVVDAVVSNLNGKVSRLGEREKNVFDCAWAASAPRYPASKQLVVNLPGVEAGSFVTYKTVSTVKGAPLEFYGKWNLDSTEPADEISLRVNGWGRKAVKPKVIPPEPMTADGDLWRDIVIVSSNDFELAAKRLRKAAKVSAVDPAEFIEGRRDMRSIRNWMAKNIRVSGPALYELPLEMQLTDPETVLRERYASRLDYIRTLAALLKGGGYDADIVFAASDADDPEELRRRDMYEKPRVRSFQFALCRVRETKGGFLGFFGEETVSYLGIENEYTPVGTTTFDGCTFLDPDDGSFGTVCASSDRFRSKTCETVKIAIRENGAVDVDFLSETYGSAVGEFRKTYAEMLPEERSRHYQDLLGNLAQAASATGDLITELESYPSRLSFSAYIPDFAVVSGDGMSIALPGLYSPTFPLAGTKRSNPVAVPVTSPETIRFEVTFPEGWTIVESLPGAYVQSNPRTGEKWLENTVDSRIVDGRLVVIVERNVMKRPLSMLPCEYFSFLKDSSRVASSRANRTILVRKATK